MDIDPVDIDIVASIGAVDRVVATEEREGGPAKVVTASRSYPAPTDDVWDAITNPERIPRWFTPVSGDLRLGGRYQLEGNAGGTITACDPPRGLAVTWEYGGEVGWVTVSLAEDGGRTVLRLEHAHPVDEARWGEFGPGAVGVGWDLALLGLGLHLSTGAAVDGGPWMESAEGKAFVRASSEGWRQASVAAGTSEQAAAEAAARTTAAYTGEG